MPTRTKASLLFFGYEQELRRTVPPTLEDVLKSYCLVQHTTKQEQSLLAPQLEQLWP